MANQRLIKEALQEALDSYVNKLTEMEQWRKDLKEKVVALEQELNLHPPGAGRWNGRRGRRGKKLPYKPSDVKAVADKTAPLNLSGKTPVEAARLIYQAWGQPLHASLVYEVLCQRNITLKSTRRPADVFASYLRRSRHFERVGPGMFRLKNMVVNPEPVTFKARGFTRLEHGNG